MSFEVCQFMECSPQINGRAGNQMCVFRAENPIKIEVMRVEGRERGQLEPVGAGQGGE